jgi:ABC-type transport system involved in multi-copper enzyme maturation permease subunit
VHYFFSPVQVFTVLPISLALLFGFDYDVFAFNYNIRMKGHYTQNWTYLYLTEDVPTRSESESTVLSYALVDKNVNSYILGDKARAL